MSLMLLNNPVLAQKNQAATRTLEWTELMPEEDLKILESMAPVDHDTLSASELEQDKTQKPNSLRPNAATSRFESAASTGAKANTKTKNRTLSDVLQSYHVRPEFNNKKIKIAGYVVPLEFSEKNTLDTFFLVPYFGACIHVPPPPPNQIIYVRAPKGFKILDINTPYWVTGTLRTETTEKEIGASAYSLNADGMVEYQEP